MFNFSVFVEKEGKFYIAKNLEFWIVSQWLTYEESIQNLKEATLLYLEDENINNFEKKFKTSNYFLTNMVV